ncbi:MAG TPA: hypothetical protein VHI52_19535, partial [Verrucomicrobiae bacterium]|nr:hypothetical protein [Verrucomicrobiae bacterium]
MNVRKLIVLGVALTGANVGGWAQTNTQVYSLADGSLLTDDCPICDRLPTVLPLTGTFKLSLLEETPLSRRYQLTDIDFQAGSKSNRLYTVSGTGVYEVGGEVAVSQNMFLDVQVNPNGVGPIEALCANSDRTVSSAWPKLRIHVDQTNG